MAESPTRLEKGREVLRAMDDRFALRALSAVLIPLLDRWTSPDPDIDAQPGFGLPRRRGPAVYRGRPPFGVSDMSAQERSISKTSIRLRQRTTRVTSARAGGGVGLVGDRSGGNEAAAHHDDDLARLYVQNLDPLHGNVSSEPPALPVDHWGLLPQRHQRSRPCGIKLADRHPVADAEEAELRR